MPRHRTPTPNAAETTAELATTDADRERHIAGLHEVDTTQPLDQRPGNGQAMVQARLDHASVDQRAAELAVKVARVAEHARFAAGISADVAHTASLYELLGRAGDATQDHALVAPDLIGQVRSEVEAWGKDRGVNGS
jgi:hypothetical protein